MLLGYLGLIRKEFIQVRRDRNMLRLIFFMPVIQLLVLGYAINTDVKKISLDVYDMDRSQLSRQFTDALSAGGYFLPQDATQVEHALPIWELDSRMKDSHSEMAILIPNDFSERMSERQDVRIGLVVDGADANNARIGMGYASLIANKFSRDMVGLKPPVELRHKFLYNPESESVYYMVPGIVATLLTMITIMLTAMAIVREREMGTLEQLMVTPMSSTAMLLGKISTFAILGLIEISIALAVGVLWFGIPFIGSPLLLFGLSGLYLLTTLGLGMFFSTITSTQQQAMFLAWFFSIFAILTAGFFTPIANMPEWMQNITIINPMRYFMVIVRGIMMKGSNISDLFPEVLALVIFGLTIFSFSLLRFSKRVA